MNTRVSGAGVAAEEKGCVLPVSKINIALALPLMVILNSSTTYSNRHKKHSFGFSLNYHVFPINDILNVF